MKKWAFTLLTLGCFVLAGMACWAQSASSERADPSQIRTNLKNILDRGEFQSVQPTERSQLAQMVKWIGEQWDKIKEWLGKLFRFPFRGIGGSPGVQWLFILVFLTVGAWLAYRLTRSALANRLPRQIENRTAFDLEDEEEIAREPDAWLQEAEKWVGEGDYRRAYRALFLAILLQFDRAGLVRYERSRTNGEYLRALRRAHPTALSEILRPLIVEFDMRWYGERPTDGGDVAAIRTQYAAVQELLKDSRAPQDNAAMAWEQV